MARKRGTASPAQRAEQASKMRAAWAEGKFAKRPTPRRPDRWTAAHDRELRALVGEYTAAEIAARLSATFPGTPRTEAAVVIRCKRIGVSRTVRHYTASQVGVLFGVDGKTITHSWLARGWLTGRRVHDVPGGNFVITAADVERFVREQRHIYDWRAMRRGQWRNLAEIVWRADPLLTVAQASTASGITAATLRNHLARGWLVGLRRLRKSGAQRGEWLIARSALARFQYRRPELVGVSGRAAVSA